MSEQLIKTPGTFGDNGNFLLERELGSGGMGSVYLGRDKMLDRPVAVKVMSKELGADAEFVEKFKKEAQAAAKLIHPNIVQVYSYGICDGMPYMALELASGGSLFQIMNAHSGKTDIQRALKICQQTAQALQCASDQGFVHGDVKPENILLDANGNAKLVDFGLAAMQKDTSEIWGTPYYISPEKVKKEPVDFRADMYSLGGTLYHALTGVAPFEGEDSIAVVKKRFEEMPKKPSEIRPEITPAVDALVMTMLAFNKEERYPSFEALLEAFKEVLSTGLTQKATRPEGVTRPTGGTGTRRVTTRLRRTAMMKKPLTTKASPATASDGDAADEDSNEEDGGNLSAKVALFVLGGILAFGAVVGGLVWYQVATKNAEIAEKNAQIQRNCRMAREAIATHRSNAEKFDAEFKKFADEATTECEKYTTELAKLLPDFASELKPEPTKELLAAQALLLNPNPTAEKAAAEPAPQATTNAPAKAAAAAPAKAETPEKAEQKPAEAASAPQAEEPKKEKAPQAVTDMRELWERAYSCQASQIKIALAMKKVVEACDKAEAYKIDSEDAMAKLAEITTVAKDLSDSAKGSKDVDNVRKGIGFINSKGKRMFKATIDDLKRQAAEKKRAEEKAIAEEAERKRLEAMAAAHKELVEKETREIDEKFDVIAASGCFRQLDWAHAIRQLSSASNTFRTAEGQIAAKFQIHKVEQMKAVQDIFIRMLPGYQFRSNPNKANKLFKAKVTKVDAKQIFVVLKNGKTEKLSWQKFYKEYLAYFNEIINQFIIKGRQTAKIRPLDWKDAMTGTALTLTLVCSEVQGATEKAKFLAQEVVRQFPDYEKMMKNVFPDYDFSEAAKEE